MNHQTATDRARTWKMLALVGWSLVFGAVLGVTGFVILGGSSEPKPDRDAPVAETDDPSPTPAQPAAPAPDTTPEPQEATAKETETAAPVAAAAETAPEQPAATEIASSLAMSDVPWQPLELAYLPPDAEAILWVRVSDILKAPLVHQLLEESGQALALLMLQIQAIFGAMLDEPSLFSIESVLLVQSPGKAGTPAPAGQKVDGATAPDEEGEQNQDWQDAFLVIARTYEAVDRDVLLKIVGRTEAKQHNNATYYLAEPSGAIRSGSTTAPGLAVHFADEQTILLGTEEAVKAAIDRGDKAPQLPEFERFNGNHHVVIAREFTDAVAQRMREQPLAKVMEHNVRSLGVSFHATEQLLVEASLLRNDEQGAAKLLAAVNAELERVRGRFAERKVTLPASRADVVAQVMSSMVARQDQTAVQVTVTLPPRAFDAETLEALRALGATDVGSGKK